MTIRSTLNRLSPAQLARRVRANLQSLSQKTKRRVAAVSTVTLVATAAMLTVLIRKRRQQMKTKAKTQVKTQTPKEKSMQKSKSKIVVNARKRAGTRSASVRTRAQKSRKSSTRSLPKSLSGSLKVNIEELKKFKETAPSIITRSRTRSRTESAKLRSAFERDQKVLNLRTNNAAKKLQTKWRSVLRRKREKRQQSLQKKKKQLEAKLESYEKIIQETKALFKVAKRDKNPSATVVGDITRFATQANAIVQDMNKTLSQFTKSNKLSPSSYSAIEKRLTNLGHQRDDMVKTAAELRGRYAKIVHAESLAKLKKRRRILKLKNSTRDRAVSILNRVKALREKRKQEEQKQQKQPTKVQHSLNTLDRKTKAVLYKDLENKNEALNEVMRAYHSHPRINYLATQIKFIEKLNDLTADVQQSYKKMLQTFNLSTVLQAKLPQNSKVYEKIKEFIKEYDLILFQIEKQRSDIEKEKARMEQSNKGRYYWNQY